MFRQNIDHSCDYVNIIYIYIFIYLLCVKYQHGPSATSHVKALSLQLIEANSTKGVRAQINSIEQLDCSLLLLAIKTSPKSLNLYIYIYTPFRKKTQPFWKFTFHPTPFFLNNNDDTNTQRISSKKGHGAVLQRWLLRRIQTHNAWCLQNLEEWAFPGRLVLGGSSQLSG